MNFLKWLYPGMRVKRWLLLAVLGVLLFSNGLILLMDLLVRWLSGGQSTVLAQVAEWAGGALTGMKLLLFFSGLAVLLLGLVLMLLGIRGWIRSIVSAILPSRGEDLVEIVYRERKREKGTKVVAIGGGTGLSTLLRGMKSQSSNVVAVVTVSDDGGSSGRLRKELGVLPPGDIRNCLVAMADTEQLMCDLFQYRFKEESGSLGGHTFGNLFLAAMTTVTGDFLGAIRESSKVLAIRGRVLPATLEPAILVATLADGSLREGETAISSAGIPVVSLSLKTAQGRVPRPPGEVLEAILSADAIILGPGSLYTSILPNLLVEGVAEEIRRSPAVKIYICNVMTQPGETDGFTASHHLQVLLNHAGRGVVEYAVMNEERPASRLLEKYLKKGASYVVPDVEEVEEMGIRPVTGNFISQTDLVRHDPEKLASAILKLISPSAS